MVLTWVYLYTSFGDNEPIDYYSGPMPPQTLKILTTFLQQCYLDGKNATHTEMGIVEIRGGRVNI